MLGQGVPLLLRRFLSSRGRRWRAECELEPLGAVRIAAPRRRSRAGGRSIASDRVEVRDRQGSPARLPPPHASGRTKGADCIVSSRGPSGSPGLPCADVPPANVAEYGTDALGMDWCSSLRSGRRVPGSPRRDPLVRCPGAAGHRTCYLDCQPAPTCSVRTGPVARRSKLLGPPALRCCGATKRLHRPSRSESASGRGYCGDRGGPATAWPGVSTRVEVTRRSLRSAHLPCRSSPPLPCPFPPVRRPGTAPRAGWRASAPGRSLRPSA